MPADRMIAERNETSHRTCTRCVMDTTVPGITFDEKGFCSFCRSAERRLVTEIHALEANSDELARTLVEEIKREGAGKQYDCIIGVSGGADSSYLAYLAKRVYGLRPLAMHFDNGWNSELAV